MNLNKSIELQKLELEKLELEQIELEKLELQKLELEKDINEIHEIYKNINELLYDQGENLETIADNISSSNLSLITTNDELHIANNYYQSYKKYTYILTGMTIIGTLLLIL